MREKVVIKDGDGLDLKVFQQQVGEWSFANFGKQPTYRPLLGAVEEIGELAHAHLKREQQIRGNADRHHLEAKDAIGDTIIYLADYCFRMGYDLNDCVLDAWAKVSLRDWSANPENGADEGAQGDN